MRISDWSSDVCSSDLLNRLTAGQIGEIGKGLTGIGHLRTHLVLAVHGRDIEDFRILRGVRMVRAGEDTQIAHLLAAERPAGDHSLHRLFKDTLGETARSEEHTSELQSLMRN